MTKTLERVGITILGLALLGLLAYMVIPTYQAFGGSPANLAAATSSTYLISASSTAGFFTTAHPSCVNRKIGTASTTLMISFNGSTTPTIIVGHFQAASTTVSYPAEDHGCGQWSVLGASGVGSFTVTEFYQ